MSSNGTNAKTTPGSHKPNGQFAKGNKIGHRFQKGEVANPHGRPPKNHAELQAMIQRIGAEVVDGKGTTRIERMLRSMHSGSGQDKQNMIEHGYGKVPNELRIKTWRDEIIDLMQQGLLSADQVRAELPEPDASELIAQAGLQVLRESVLGPDVVDVEVESEE